MLVDEAKIVDNPRGYAVRIYRPDGDISVEARIEQLRETKRFNDCFGEPPVEVSAKQGIENLSDHFADIASGKVRVTD